MAREMSPQERADLKEIARKLVLQINEITPMQWDKHDDKDQAIVLAALQATRRAALLEAVQMIEDDCYGGVDYFSDADTTLSFTDQMKRAHNKNQAKLAEQVRKLAQEG